MLHSLGIPETPNIDQIMAEPLTDSELRSRSEFIGNYFRKYAKAFDEKYGKDTDDKLNESALAAFDAQRLCGWRIQLPILDKYGIISIDVELHTRGI